MRARLERGVRLSVESLVQARWRVRGTDRSPRANQCSANAQQANKMYRIGVLSEGLAPTAGGTGGPRPLFGEDTWRTAFRQRGYVEGQNTLFEFRHAGERFERLPQLAEDLVRAKVDVIIAASTPTALPAKRMTGNVPIIAIS